MFPDMEKILTVLINNLTTDSKKGVSTINSNIQHKPRSERPVYNSFDTTELRQVDEIFQRARAQQKEMR